MIQERRRNRKPVRAYTDARPSGQTVPGGEGSGGDDPPTLGHPIERPRRIERTNPRRAGNEPPERGPGKPDNVVQAAGQTTPDSGPLSGSPENLASPDAAQRRTEAREGSERRPQAEVAVSDRERRGQTRRRTRTRTLGLMGRLIAFIRSMFGGGR